MNPTHFKNKSGHIVPANEQLIKYWKNLELEPIYKEEKPKDSDTSKRAELKAKTVTELKAMCKEASITGYSKMTEDELIDALLAE